MTWNLTRRTVVRAAALRTLKRFLVTSQTLEPTNVAGFNQLTSNGTSSWRYGAGIDQKVWQSVYVGGDFSYRDNSSPLISGANENVSSTTGRTALDARTSTPPSAATWR